jgi:RimJ/RimL family protein N-acetyltransferase
VLLRSLSISDLENLLPFSLNEPELWDFSLLQARNENELRQYIKSALLQKAQHTAYPFLIFDKAMHQPAGSTRFYAIQERESCLSIGYTWIGKRFQGTGLNKAVKTLMLDFAFNQLNAERIEFRADSKNIRSISAIQSLGATFEGILRNHCFRPDGSRRDTAILSILRNEYNSEKNIQRKFHL